MLDMESMFTALFQELEAMGKVAIVTDTCGLNVFVNGVPVMFIDLYYMNEENLHDDFDYGQKKEKHMQVIFYRNELPVGKVKIWDDKLELFTDTEDGAPVWVEDNDG